MKKIISLTIVFLIVSALALQGKMKTMLIHEKAVTKTVEFSVFVANSYSSPLYKNSQAKVVLTVSKLKGNDNGILWSNVIKMRNLNKYPLAANPIYKKLTIYNIKEHSESLVASYKIIYNTRGSQLYYEQNYLIEHANGNVLAVAL